jgi:ubiquinone/menaquinone biosynthesis C-methylase UbiE
MNIDFKESEKSLNSRIKIHDLYGSANLDDWVLEQLKVKPDEKILDLGCGNGKQCFAIRDYFNKKFRNKNIEIIGIDEHKDLIKLAQKKNGSNIVFKSGSFDNKLLFDKQSFDLVISCFAIYYADNVKKTLLEIKRILKSNGRIFFIGPMSNNKFEFNEIIEKAANDKIPKLIGSSRFSTEIYGEVKKIFYNAKIKEFRNHLSFDTIDPFMEYTIASLEKNRKVYDEFLKNKDLKKLLEKVKKILEKKILSQGKLEITKVVGGISASNI